MTSIQIEAFSILDHKILSGILADEDPTPAAQALAAATAAKLQRKFERSFLIIGCGAWQALWDELAAVGFDSAHPRQYAPNHKALAQMLRPEILNRFNSAVLVLPPLRSPDYNALLREAVATLPSEFTPIIMELAERTIEQAVAEKRGFRWIQELIAGAIREIRLNDRNRSTPAQATASESFGASASIT